jgi:putative flippase GtrA
MAALPARRGGPLGLDRCGTRTAPPTAGPRLERVAGALLSARARPLRFVITGATAAVFQLGVLSLLTRQGWPGPLADSLACVFAAQVNFCLSQRFTWRDRLAGGDALLGRWLRFQAAAGAAAVLNLSAFAVAATVLPALVAAGLGIAAGAAASYAGNERLVFRPATRRAGALRAGRPSGDPGGPLRRPRRGDAYPARKW